MNIHSIEKFKESVDKQRIKSLEIERDLLKAEVTNYRQMLRDANRRVDEYKGKLEELEKGATEQS